MSDEDWFRLKNWSAENQKAFLARLNRSRSEFHKAQYLRIQAYELVNDISKPDYKTALFLLEHLLTEFPCESELSCALMQQGECYMATGKNELALNSLGKALRARRNYPNSNNSSHQLYAELVLQMKLDSRYLDALSVIDEFLSSEPFPIMRYKTARARSLLHDRIGNSTEAKKFAMEAICAANTDESPFTYHKKLGLVHTPDSRMHKRLVELCR